MNLTITQSENQGWTVIAVEGEIDLATAGSFDEALENVMGAGRTKIAVDLEPVAFMDSTGLRALVKAHQRLDETDGTLAVICSAGPARRLLELAGVMATLTVVESVDALAHR